MSDGQSIFPPADGGPVPPVSPDRELVARLAAGDSAAWETIHRDIVIPLFRANIKGIAQQCARVGLADDAVFSRLYVNLSRDDFAPLRAFRFGCAFSSWLYWHVWNAAQGAIREATGKFGPRLSDSAVLDALPQQKAPASAPDTAEAVGEANRLLARLWERNPVYALVLVLRNDIGLSARETGILLGKSSANVDQINHRAQARMRELRAQHHEGA
jgi:DNA-directed RNA polymerase specialized sigma24 family protein